MRKKKKMKKQQYDYYTDYAAVSAIAKLCHITRKKERTLFLIRANC